MIAAAFAVVTGLHLPYAPIAGRASASACMRVGTVVRMEEGGGYVSATDAANAGKPIRELYQKECDRMGSTGAYVMYREDVAKAWNDADGDDDDFISQDEVKAVMVALNEPDIGEEEVSNLYKASNPRPDGKIGFAPFIKAFCDSASEKYKPEGSGEKKFFGLF